MKRLLSLPGVFVAMILVLPACTSTTTFSGECKRDSDCEQYERCDTLDFRCVCASDEACAQGEYCNPSGSCQITADCFTNDDCTDGSICNVQTGECIASNNCTTDFHCDIGQICDSGFCRLGCRDTSDCDLEAREVCINTSCVLGKCENNLYCEKGEICDQDISECVLPQDPYCLNTCSPICEFCGLGDSPCGDPAHICSGPDIGPNYCWVSCSPGGECPSGYQCVPTTVSWGICDVDADCADILNTCGAGSHRCALNQQVCDPANNDADCWDFGTATCLSGFCVFGYHCEPPGGCANL